MPETSILNVDDYVPGRYARSRVLRQLGLPVIEAGSGAEAFEMVHLHKPGIILLDVNLPDMTGYEVCRKLRNNPETASTTIVHISASSVLTEHQVHGLNSGADGYIVEPVEPSVLLATVNAFLRARRAEEALRQSNEELRWFSYRVGHDLNAPLRTITTYAQLVKTQIAADDQVHKHLDFIADSALRMQSFMSGLLKYAEAVTEQPLPGSVDAAKILERVRGNLDAALRESAAELTSDPLPALIATQQLEYVFQNLIGNAIKYARPDVAPRIHVSARQDGSAWIFSVRDNGRGIAKQYYDKIFEVFARLEGQSIPGNGIGLALSKKIVESHSGTLWLDSEPETGSTFYFRIPQPD